MVVPLKNRGRILNAGAHLAYYKEQVGRGFGKMTGYSVECLEAYSLMTGTCGPGRCIFDKLPRTSY